jgi:hypothetical protein
MKPDFTGGFSENTEINLITNRPVVAELFYADGRTEMTKLIFAFRNFANVRKNTTRIVVWYRRSSTSVHYKPTPLMFFVREIWD